MPSPTNSTTAKSSNKFATPTMLPENHPLTMARLQQSARDILRNFEVAMAANGGSTPTSSASLLSKSALEGKNSNDPSSLPVSLEQTLRSMFTSCTSGAGMAAASCDDDGSDDDDDDETTSRATMQLGGVPKVGTSSTDSSSSIDTPVKPKVKRSKSVSRHPARKMMSSTKDSLRRLASMHIIESNDTKQTEERSQPQQRQISSNAPSASKAAVDHIYEHLFFAEEQVRRAAATAAVATSPATKDVTVLHTDTSAERPVVTPPSKPEEAPFPNQSPVQVERVGIIPLRRMTQPFPISKPQNTTVAPSPLAYSQPMRSVSTPNITTIVSPNFTFDDDISAISANTLEAMMMTVPHPDQKHLNSDTIQNGDVLLPPKMETDLTVDFPIEKEVTPPALKYSVQLSKDAFCRASTIPRANQANQEREDVERINSLSSTSTIRTKQRIWSYNSTGRSNIKSPTGFQYNTPSSSRSMASNTSNQQQQQQQQLQQRFNASFSPCTSGNSNQSFDRWRTVEQEFWDSVVANDDDNDDVNDRGISSAKPKKSKSLSSNRQSSRRSRSRIRSFDGWSEPSTFSRSRDATTGTAITADVSIFSSSMTAISRSGSSHGTLPPQRSQSWLALHPHNHPHDPFPVIFASTAIPDNDGFFLDHRTSTSAFPFDTVDSGEI